MKYTIYHAQYRTLNLIKKIGNEPNKMQLTDLESCLKKLNQHFSDGTSRESLDLIRAQEYRKAAIEANRQGHLLLKEQHRSQLKSICIALVCLAQRIESLSEPSYINKFHQRIEPLISGSCQLGATVLRPLSQHSSVYLAGHKGICAIAAKEWLADNFMNDQSGISETASVDSSTENFIKTVEFHKEELCFLYALEKENKKCGLTFFLVTGLLRLSNGTLLLALLDELAENKNVYFFITFAHFRNRLFHSVGCKFNQDQIQWFDTDCGIFQSQHKPEFANWLDFYLEQNHYRDRFSFFTVQVGERTPILQDTLSNGVKYMRHLFS